MQLKRVGLRNQIDSTFFYKNQFRNNTVRPTSILPESPAIHHLTLPSTKWHIAIGHTPNRAQGAAQGQVLVGHMPVKEQDLDGYRKWKAAFDKGEAGVF